MPPDVPTFRPRLTGLVLAMFTLVLGLALVFSGRIPSRVAYDQKLYHEPTIRQFADQWPDFDVWHYKSATTPGYHLLQAAVTRFVSPSVMAMQLVSLAIATGLMFLLGWSVGSRAPPLLTLSVTLPFACSMYVIQSSAWLLPDNLGWLGVLAILCLAMRDHATLARLALGGLILLALVFVRQIHGWAAGLLWISAWLSATTVQATPVMNDDTRAPSLVPFSLICSNVPRSFRQTALAVAVSLPAVVLLLLFNRYWHGLVPPVFQGWYKGLNVSAFVFILATFGAFSPFFSPLWLPHLSRLWKQSRSTLVAISLLVLVASCVVPTNHDYLAGRRSGLWNIAAKLPLISGYTSPFMVGLALLGAVSLLALAYAHPARRRLVLLAAVLGYAAASTANHDLFQRYVDPFALMILALLSGLAPAEGLSPSVVRRARRLAGPAALSLLLLGASFYALRNSDAIDAPPPPATQPGEGKAPCELPPPPKPPDHHFWPW